MKEERELVFRLTAKPRIKPNRFGFVSNNQYEQYEAAIYETAEEGRLLGVHYCPCHDFWPYTPKALMEAVMNGTCRKIICCFPADAKRRHPSLAPYILGDWEGVTLAVCGCGNCEACIEGGNHLAICESESETVRHRIQEALGIDHMSGKVPRYDPLKKAA